MLRRTLFTTLLLAATFDAGAQQSDAVSLFLGGAAFAETNLAAFAPEDFSADLIFEKGGSVTASWTHYWRDHFATEVSVIGMGADSVVRVEDGAVETKVDFGRLGLGAVTAAAQWHFRRGARVSPYAGGGLALIGGEIEAELEDEPVFVRETVELEGAGSIVLNGGVNFRMTDRLVLALDAKVIPYTAEIESEEEEEIDEIDLHPFLVSVGLRYRF
jgi:outer membrane protein W